MPRRTSGDRVTAWWMAVIRFHDPVASASHTTAAATDNALVAKQAADRETTARTGAHSRFEAMSQTRKKPIAAQPQAKSTRLPLIHVAAAAAVTPVSPAK